MKLAEYMTREGLSQSDVADSLGISQSTVHRWLTGEHFPSFTMAWRIARVTGGAVQPNDWKEPVR